MAALPPSRTHDLGQRVDTVPSWLGPAVTLSAMPVAKWSDATMSADATFLWLLLVGISVGIKPLALWGVTSVMGARHNRPGGEPSSFRAMAPAPAEGPP